MNEKYAKFIDLLKGLTIKIPFLEAMAQMPTYSKEILAKKRRVNEEEVIEVPQLSRSQRLSTWLFRPAFYFTLRS